MKNIVITQPAGLTDAQLAELKSLGNVTYYDTISKDDAEWLARIKGADVIYTNHHSFDDNWRELRDVFVTLPFVGVGFLDPAVLKQNNVVISRSPGCNKIAVSEWIVGVMLNYTRRLADFTKVTHFEEPTPIYTESLYGKVVCILGKGAIGSRTGRALEALGMDVRYYTRHDDLATQLKGAEFVIDCLSLNPTTVGFYNEAFFAKVDDNAVFVAIGSNETKEMGALLHNLESGKLRHFITDSSGSRLFDTADAEYTALLDNPKVTITPHVAAYTDNTRETAAKMCIENIKAYLAGAPINVVGEI